MRILTKQEMKLIKGAGDDPDFCYMGGSNTLGQARWCILSKAGAQAVNDNHGTNFTAGTIIPSVPPGQYFTLLQVIQYSCTFAQMDVCNKAAA